MAAITKEELERDLKEILDSINKHTKARDALNRDSQLAEQNIIANQGAAQYLRGKIAQLNLLEEEKEEEVKKQ